MKTQEDRLEQFVNASLAVIAALIFISILVLVVVNLIRGFINNPGGFLLAGAVVYLAYKLVKANFSEVLYDSEEL